MFRNVPRPDRDLFKTIKRPRALEFFAARVAVEERRAIGPEQMAVEAKRPGRVRRHVSICALVEADCLGRLPRRPGVIFEEGHLTRSHPLEVPDLNELPSNSRRELVLPIDQGADPHVP